MNTQMQVFPPIAQAPVPLDGGLGRGRVVVGVQRAALLVLLLDPVAAAARGRRLGRRGLLRHGGALASRAQDHPLQLRPVLGVSSSVSQFCVAPLVM